MGPERGGYRGGPWGGVTAVRPLGPDGYPIYSRGERAADAAMHVIGVVAALIAGTVLVVTAAGTGDGWRIASVAVYGLGMCAVFLCSAAYHLISVPAWRDTLRKLDHAAIFLKIAGTYTPFSLVSLGGGAGAALMAAVWSIAAVGVPLKLLAPRRYERATVWLYLAQGWLVVFAFGPLIESIHGRSFALICIGGALYTLGVAFHIAERLPYSNAIWHALVIAGSGCMYAAVMTEVAA